ncbi:Glycosyltransferase 64 protein C4 [Homalodisca vitripennis]|nr:Glycosyltransferase 64 protein C4 [Homalodisca vitripennis]
MAATGEEHHLQRAIVTGLIIPTPEVIQVGDMAAYNRLYAPNFKVPKQLIHMQPFTMEQDIPDYDMDSEDERWLDVHSKTMDINALKFEEMMDRLEKNSGHSVVTQMEAKVLLKEDDDLIIAVYDYWLNKRLKTYTASRFHFMAVDRPLEEEEEFSERKLFTKS